MNTRKFEMAKKSIAVFVVFGLLFPAPAYSVSPTVTRESGPALNTLVQDLLATAGVRSEARRINFGFNAPELKTTHSLASANVGRLLKQPLGIIPDKVVNEVRAYLQRAYDKKWLKGVQVLDITASHIQIHVAHNYGADNADVHRIILEAVRAGLKKMKSKLNVDPDTMSALELTKALQLTFARDHSFVERDKGKKGTAESVEVAMGVGVDISAFNNTAWELFGNIDLNPASTLSGDRIRGYRFYIQKRDDILHGRNGVKVLEVSEGDDGKPDVYKLRAIKILLAQTDNIVTAVYPVRGGSFDDATEPLMTVAFQPAFGSNGESILNPIAIFRGQSGGPAVGSIGHTVANTRYVLGGKNAEQYVALRPLSHKKARRPIKEEGIGGFIMYGYEQAGNGYMPRNGYISDYYGLSPRFLHSYIKKSREFAKVMLAHKDFQPFLHPRAAAKKAEPVRHKLNSRFTDVVKDFEADPIYADAERRVLAGELIKITSGKADYGALNGHTKAAAIYTALQRAYLQVMKEKGLIVDYYTLGQDPNRKMDPVQLEKNYAAGDDTHLTVIGGKTEDLQLIIKRAMATGAVFHMLAFGDEDQKDKPGVGTYGLFQDLQGDDADAVKKDPFGWLGLGDETLAERFFKLAYELADKRDAKTIGSVYHQWQDWKQTHTGHEVQEIVRGSGNTSAQGIGIASQYLDPKKDKGYAELDADKMGPQAFNILFYYAMLAALKDHPDGLITEIWDVKAFDENGRIAFQDMPKNWSDISYLVRSALKAKIKRITPENAEWLQKTVYQNGTLAFDLTQAEAHREDLERLDDILKEIGFVPSKRIFLDVATELDQIKALLADSDRFNVKAMWDKKQPGWDPERFQDYLDRPIAMSTVSRLGLLAGGEYVGKDDPKLMGVIRFMQHIFDYLAKNPWMLQGDMNGSHQMLAMLVPVEEAVATLLSAPIAVGLINHFDEQGRLTQVTDVFKEKRFKERSDKSSDFNLDFVGAQRATNPHIVTIDQVEGAYALKTISDALDDPDSPLWLHKLHAQNPKEYPEPDFADASNLYTAATSDQAVAYQELSAVRAETRTPAVLDIALGDVFEVGNRSIEIASASEDQLRLNITDAASRAETRPSANALGPKERLRTGRSEARMLVLSRQKNESIMIGDNIEVFIVDIRGDKVRLGIKAPTSVPVHRQEVYDAIQRLQAEREEGRRKKQQGGEGPANRAETRTPPLDAAQKAEFRSLLSEILAASRNVSDSEGASLVAALGVTSSSIGIVLDSTLFLPEGFLTFALAVREFFGQKVPVAVVADGNPAILAHLAEINEFLDEQKLDPFLVTQSVERAEEVLKTQFKAKEIRGIVSQNSAVAEAILRKLGESQIITQQKLQGLFAQHPALAELATQLQHYFALVQSA